MPHSELNTINIGLNSIEDLFLEPDFNPFNLQSRFQSGIDELVEQVRDLSMKRPLKICLSLASQSNEAEFDRLVKNALNRYCTVKIRECEQSIHELQSQGKRDLVYALLLSFIMVLGEFFIVQMSFLPEVFSYLLATGFGLIAWVVLWPPLDKLLYEWRPCRRAQRIYKYLQSAKVEINSR